MSYEESSPSSRKNKTLSPLIPISILAASLILVFTWQISNILSQSDTMRDTKGKYAEAILKREDLVKQSGEVQAKLQAVVGDLMVLSKTDDKAKEIVKKHGIQQTAPPAAPADATATK
jgi:hypothetical protein